MTKAELINEISEKTGIDKEIVSPVLETYFETIKNTLSNNDGVFVRGFGSFVNKKRAAKKARNIKTKTAVMVEEHHIPVFKAAREFTDLIKGTVK